MTQPDGKKSSLAKAFGYAFSGIAAASRERNFRIELCFAVAAIVLGFAFQISLPEWLAVVICIGAVLGLECINTALEAVVDIASPDFNPLAGRAKDCCAGAVLIMSIAAFIVGFVLFAPRLLALVGLW